MTSKAHDQEVGQQGDGCLIGAHTQTDTDGKKEINQFFRFFDRCAKTHDRECTYQTQTQSHRAFYDVNDEHGGEGEKHKVSPELFPVGNGIAISGVELTEDKRQSCSQQRIQQKLLMVDEISRKIGQKIFKIH